MSTRQRRESVHRKIPRIPDNSVAAKPRPDISFKTRELRSMVPQPGTSQTPQEMGAEATRERKSDTISPSLERSTDYGRMKEGGATSAGH